MDPSESSAMHSAISQMSASRIEAASDGTLLRRFQRGHQDAATQLYLRYAGRLRALAAKQSSKTLAARFDPDDVVQSVFRTFFRRAAKGGYDIPDGDELWKLFLVIGLNKIRTLGSYHLAGKRNAKNTVSGDATSWAVNAATPGEESDLAMLQLVVEDLLAGLPEGHRAMIEMRIAGHEVAEIAQQTGRAKRSVERVLQNFRTALRQQIDG